MVVPTTTSQLESLGNTPLPSQESDAFLLEDLEVVKSNDVEAIKALPAFVVSTERGFLPRENPLISLPSPFEHFDSLLQRMTIHQPVNADGDRLPGLLALGTFGETVLQELAADGPEVKEVERLCKEAEEGKRVTQLLTALFRDYCFATSAYLLEPTDVHFRATGKYAPGRDRLPAQLAIPMVRLAEVLGHFPFMEYASSYALVNWRIKDPDFVGAAGPFSFDNLELIRAFEDPTGSERGFILVHIEMVSYSGLVVKATNDSINAAMAGDVPAFENSLADLLAAYQKINKSMETMWSRSKKEDYLNFRSFIFGTAPKLGNPMFPNGVVYEGTSNLEPRYYRGESGANDSLLPNLDNFLEITSKLPNNEFTKVLRDFRTYRPANQREYIQHLESRAQIAKIRQFSMETSGSVKAKALYLLLVDQDREIRHRHWNFTKSYIIENSEYPIATGGSPILKYLPHNLAVTLKVLDETFSAFTPSTFEDLKTLGEEGEILAKRVKEAGERADQQRRILEREVEKLKNEKSTLGNGMEMGKILTAKKVSDSNPTNRGAVGCDGVG